MTGRNKVPVLDYTKRKAEAWPSYLCGYAGRPTNCRPWSLQRDDHKPNLGPFRCSGWKEQQRPLKSFPCGVIRHVDTNTYGDKAQLIHTTGNGSRWIVRFTVRPLHRLEYSCWWPSGPELVGSLQTRKTSDFAGNLSAVVSHCVVWATSL
jgi:hypothetical protein